MAAKHSEEFKRDAVHIALTSGLTHRQASSDLGGGMSILNKWIKTYRDTDIIPKEDQELVKENERLRRENRVLKEESRSGAWDARAAD
ncbi:MAG: hypothetical protein COB39_10890 [Marinosulfonomonas sp.]|nr:MAG: hypothetical protein COB39_10890 [Marinosulfonomonas sp.]